MGPNRRYSSSPKKKSPAQPPSTIHYMHAARLGGSGNSRGNLPRGGQSDRAGGQCTIRLKGQCNRALGAPTGNQAVITARARARLVLLFLLFLSRAPAAGEGQAQRGAPLPLPETALRLSPLLSSPALLPPSLLPNLLLPHLAPSGVPSCSPCFLSPPWERKGLSSPHSHRG